MTETALIRLARFAAEDPLTADRATPAVLRDGIIDTLGCIIAGAKSDVTSRARKVVSDISAQGPAPVIGTEMSTSRPHAAFLNAVAGNALDFDDWEIPGNTHTIVVLFPALLAVSSQEICGMDLARAHLAGYEVIARLARRSISNTTMRVGIRPRRWARPLPRQPVPGSWA